MTTTFEYLLNAMEGASKERTPWLAEYPQKRVRVLEYVANLEATLASERSSRERAERLVSNAQAIIQKAFSDAEELESPDYHDMREWLMAEAFPPRAPSSPAATEPETVK